MIVMEVMVSSTVRGQLATILGSLLRSWIWEEGTSAYDLVVFKIGIMTLVLGCPQEVAGNHWFCKPEQVCIEDKAWNASYF